MKPEVRRALAKEWITLMSVAVLIIPLRVGWIWKTRAELNREWSEKAEEHDNWETFEHTGTLGTFRRDPFDPQITRLKEKSKREITSIKISLENYPSPRTKECWIASATWAVEWSWLVYLALWVPRLTVSSIRLLRNSVNKTAQP